MPKTAAVRAHARAAKPKPVPLFIKVSAKGKPLPKSAKDWAATICTAYRTANGLPLMFTARDIGSHVYEASLKTPEGFQLCGEKDWYQPNAVESMFMLDHSQRPAMDPNFFIGEPGWQWTSTPVASDSSCAFCVGLRGGGVGWGGRGGSGLVRLCREVPASQCSAFGIPVGPAAPAAKTRRSTSKAKAR
jgi:hypothetical protein